MRNWLRCIFHDLFGHPAVLNHCQCHRCAAKGFCFTCWHHFTVSY